MTALDKAIEIAGSAEAQLNAWDFQDGYKLVENDGKGVVPAHRVLSIHQATGVTPHELRPDLYPNPTDGLPQATQDSRPEN